MAVIGRPPGLAVGHQRGEVALQRLIVERLERLGIIEIVAHRVGRGAALVEDVEAAVRATSRGWCRPSSERTLVGPSIGHPDPISPVFASMILLS